MRSATRPDGSDAGVADVRVELLDDPADHHALARVFSRIWHTADPSAPVPPELLRALSHTGNYVAGVFEGDELVGGSCGFLYRDAEAGGLALRSQVSGVRGTDRRLGFLLKQHQRTWALANGLRTITWTFDPLVRRNAYFNLTKLGAAVVALHENFYGPMGDAINGGDESDRCVVRWDLSSDRATAAAEGRRTVDDVDVLLAAGFAVALDAGPDGAPVVHDVAGPRLCWIPDDIVVIRSSSPDLARAWRLAARAAMGRALDDGLRGVAVTRSGHVVLR